MSNSSPQKSRPALRFLLLRVLLPIVAGSLWFLSFPPFSFSGLVWLIPLPLLFAISRPSRFSGWRKDLLNAFTGWIFGLTAFGGMFLWINEVSTLGYFTLIPYLALYPALFAVIAARIGFISWPLIPHSGSTVSPSKSEIRFWALRTVLPSLASSALIACAWISTEWLRGWMLTGFGWNGLGIGLRFSLPLWQLAEWSGANALAFLPVFTASVIFFTIRRLTLLHAIGRRSSHWDLVASMALICALFLIGVVRMNAIAKLPTAPLNAILIQENHSLKFKQNPANQDIIENNYLESTNAAIESSLQQSWQAAQQHGSSKAFIPDWIIWPESALPRPNYFVGGSLHPETWNSELINGPIARFRELSGPFTLISGADNLYFDKPEGELVALENSISAWPADYSSLSSRAKRHLVPFGEYIPLRSSLPILEQAFAWSSGQKMAADFSPGADTSPISLPTASGNVDLIPAICFEDTLGRVLRPAVRPDSPQVIVNVTNDNWFGQSPASMQHFWNAQIRAIEFRRPMLRAANTGVTAAILATGEIVTNPDPAILLDAKGSPFIRDSLAVALPVPSHPPTTLYSILGDWFSALCGVVTLLALVLPALAKKFLPEKKPLPASLQRSRHFNNH